MEPRMRLAAKLAVLVALLVAVARSGADSRGDQAAFREAAQAVDRQLAAYRAVVGRAAPDGSAGPDPQAWSTVVRGDEFPVVATHSILDWLLGEDFEPSLEVQGQGSDATVDPKLPGRVRGGGDAGVRRELIDASRADFEKAVRTGRWRKASRLETFWRRHPDYRPGRGGRCFRTAAEGFPYASSAECIRDSMQRLAGWVRGEALAAREQESKIIRPRAACNCAWSSDCSTDELCLGSCTPAGNYDGKCTRSRAPKPI